MSPKTCPTCGAPIELGLDHCPACHGWRCNVCLQPVYRDESFTYNALGQMHVRCSDGVPQPRPDWISQPATNIDVFEQLAHAL